MKVPDVGRGGFGEFGPLSDAELPCSRLTIEGRLRAMSGLRWFPGMTRTSGLGLRCFWSVGACLVMLVFTGEAHAVPGEKRAGLEVGAAASPRVNVSPTLGVRAAYGLESNLELQLEVSGLWLQHGVDPLVTQLVPALAYRFDVVRWVPFVRVGAGALFDWQEPSLVGLASGAIGMEYLWDRSLSASLTYQADFWLLRPEHSVAALPIHRATLGITWSSGW